MNIRSSDTARWAESLSDFAPNYTPIKCWSVLMFYTLAGRKSVICKENMIPIPELEYAVYSPQEKRFYIKPFRGYPLEVLFFYEANTMWDSWDSEINAIRRYIEDSNLYVLFTPTQVADTTAMLTRLYKSHFSGTGKLSYKTYIRLLEEYLKLEDYKSYAMNIQGFKTVCKMFDDRINALWESSRKN